MRLKSFALVSVIGGMAIASLADDAGTKVALSDTPAAVQKTIQAQVADGKMGDITKSADGEDTDYDVDLTTKDGTDRDFTVAKDGKEMDFTVDDDGTLDSMEVDLSQTPGAVQKAINAQLNGGKVSEIDENFDDDGNNF